MEFDDDVPGDIGFQDWMGYLRDDFGRENWLTVYRKSRGTWGASYFYCALIPSSQTEAAMANESWDLFYGHGLPGCSVSYGGNGQTVRYHRFGTDSGIEPLTQLSQAEIASLWRNDAGILAKNPLNRRSIWVSDSWSSTERASRSASIRICHASTKRRSATSSHIAQNKVPMVHGSVASRAATANSW